MFDLLAQTAPSVSTPGVTTPGVTTPGETTPAAAPVNATQPSGVEAPVVTTGTTAPGTAAAKPAPPDAFVLIKNMGPIVLMVIIFFFLMNRSNKKKDKGRTDMLGKMKKGDEVQTIGGILGKVMEARDDKVLIKVDENSNTKIWFSRTAIHRVVGADEEAK